MPYALCPMPYALCPMPYALCRIVPDLSDQGYICYCQWQGAHCEPYN